MSTKRKSKKEVFPIIQAHQMSSPVKESYYDDTQKSRLEHDKKKYSKVDKKNIKKDDTESESESSSSSEHTIIEIEQKKEQSLPKKSSNMKPKGVPSRSSSKHKTEKKPSKTNYDEEENKENKGILAKAADAVKGAVGSKEKPKLKSTKVTIELPRDILTAFFLLRLPRDKSRGIEKGEKEPYWNEYSLYGKVFLWLSVLIPYGIQWFVLCVLLQELASKWSELKSVDAGNDFWYNTTAFAVLFLYMWKDLASFYFSVWYYISWLQKKKGGIMGNIKDAAIAGGDLVKSESNVDVSEAAHEAVEEVKTAIKFIEFKLWLLSVVFLYIGLTCYSLLSIPLEEGLVGKLEVSLSIFFVLEVDDWAYELFIAQANILEDDEFDVKIIMKKDRKGFVKKQQKHLATTIILVVSSILGFWALGWGLNQIPP